jgi:hypothetical protein
MRVIETLIVLIVDGATEILDDELDKFAVAIEQALDPYPSPAQRFDLVGTSLDLQPDEDGAKWFGYMALEYRGVIFTGKGDPTTAA